MSKFKSVIFSLLSLAVFVSTNNSQAQQQLSMLDQQQVQQPASMPALPRDEAIAMKGEKCDPYVPVEKARIPITGPNDPKFNINYHNGEPVIEAKICGVKVIPQTGPRLKGILLTTPWYYRNKLNSYFATPGFYIRDLKILTQDPDARDRLLSYKNDEINEDMLNGVIRDIVVLMRDKNQPVVDVYFPEQDVSDGYVVGLVERAILDKVIVNGNQYYSDEEIGGNIRLQKGDYVWSDILSQDMRWINSYPYRQVDAIFKPGSKPRTTDIILETADMTPFRIFGGYDNYGPSATNQNQVYAGFSYGDLFGADQEVIYTFGSSIDFANFNSHTLQYIIPFAELRNRLSLTGSISESEPKSTTPFFTSEGQNIFLNADYEIPLYDYGIRGFVQGLRFGADFKQLENNIDFGGTQVFSSSPEVAQAYVTYEGTRSSSIVSHIFRATAVGSPGDITGNNSDAEFNTASSGAEAQYAYFKGVYDTRYTFADLGGVSLGGLFRGQYSPMTTLLSSEQAAISGPGAVRGFQTNNLRRDNAFVSTVEVATPYVPVLDTILKANVRDRVQGFVFYDRGYGDNDSASAAGHNSINLDSAGVGARFGLGRNLNGVVEYGHELHDELHDGKDQEIHIRVNAAY